LNFFKGDWPRATSPFLALGQEGTFGHALNELFRAGTAADHRRENRAHRQIEALELARRELIGSCGGVDARLKQDFVRIDVADSGDNLLVYQQRLHIALVAQRGHIERGKIQTPIKSVRSQPFGGDEGGHEPAHVEIGQQW